jgi:hypothetical protein
MRFQYFFITEILISFSSRCDASKGPFAPIRAFATLRAFAPITTLLEFEEECKYVQEILKKQYMK